MPLIESCAGRFGQLHPDVRIILVPRGSELGLDDLHRKKVHIAMVSSLLRPRASDEFPVTVARSSIVMIYNKRNPMRERIQDRGVTVSELQKIYSAGKISSWSMGTGDSIELHPYARGDLAGATGVLAGFLYLDKNEIIGIPVIGEDEMIQIVQRDSLALGYCNINAAFDMQTYEKRKDIELLPIDLNQNGILEPREELCSDLFDFTRDVCRAAYPHLLTRNLYLVVEDPPGNDVALEFIRYVLTDGRRFADSLGYPPISEEVRDYEMYRLEKRLNNISD